MSDFDDFRNLTDDVDEDFSDFSFDDIVDDEDEFAYGQEIGSEDEFSQVAVAEPGPLNKVLSSMTAQQRLLLAIMAFGNVLVLSVGLLLATGRIG